MTVKKGRPHAEGGRRGILMLQFMQQNFLLYGMAALGILGAASQIILRVIYGKLIRDMENPAFAKGKYMKHLKQKYNMYRRTQTGTESIQAFIQKSLMEYKYWGMNLHTWYRLGGAAFILCALIGIGGWYLAGTLGAAQTVRQNYLWALLATTLLIAGTYGVTDTGYKRKYLETGLRSMFTNSSTQTVQMVDLSAAAPPAAEKKPFQSVKNMQDRKRRDKNVETQAQRDKRELKANLTKLKEGIAESAAAENKKEQNTEILKQMDPAEQERVIREVLKEFL